MTLLGIKIASQIDPKSAKKGIETKVQFGLGFGPLLEGFLVILVPSLGQAGSKLAPKSGKLGSQDDVKKMSQKMSSSESRGRGGWSLITD